MLKQEQESETNYDIGTTRLPEASLELEAPPEAETLAAETGGYRQQRQAPPFKISKEGSTQDRADRMRIVVPVAISRLASLASPASAPSQWVAYLIAGIILTFVWISRDPRYVDIDVLQQHYTHPRNEPMPGCNRHYRRWAASG